MSVEADENAWSAVLDQPAAHTCGLGQVLAITGHVKNGTRLMVSRPLKVKEPT